MLTLEKMAAAIVYVAMIITIIGAFSTGKGAFITSGIFCLIPLAISLVKFLKQSKQG